jgi:hypothetical protein
MVTEMTVPHINANLNRFGMEPTAPQGKWYKEMFCEKALDPYAEAYRAWSNPATRTPIIIVQMKGAQKTFTTGYRELYRMMKGNPLVTDADLEAMGFPIRPFGRRSSSRVAAEAPGFSITTLEDHRLSIHYYTFAAAAVRKGKPAGQLGAELRWMFSETPVIDANDLLNSALHTSSPIILPFHGKDHGRAVYLAMRWENTRGGKGPWSPIKMAYVP